MQMKDRDRNREVQLERLKPIQTCNENQENWKDKNRLGNPFEEFRKDFVRML